MRNQRFNFQGQRTLFGAALVRPFWLKSVLLVTGRKARLDGDQFVAGYVESDGIIS
jgi:hypothetical protein